MKIVRFSKVVEKCGKPEVYLLMSETDPEFQKAVDAEKIMSLSDESHGSGTEFGTVGYNKKRHGQLLLFPKSLKSFADAKVIGIKYELLGDEGEDEDEKPVAPRKKEGKKAKQKLKVEEPVAKRSEAKAVKKKTSAKPHAKKVIPFPARKEEHKDDAETELLAYVRQAMRALEKGNAVAAYNLLKRIIPEP